MVIMNASSKYKINTMQSDLERENQKGGVDALLEISSETPTEIANTWNSGQEELLAAIGDRSNCLRWMHSKCQDTFAWYNFAFTLPSIAVSSLVGSLTMSLPSLTTPENTTTATTALGLLGIGVGVLTSINQYMKCAQLAEAHRASAVAYGKLHRSILNELAIRRDQRSNALEYLKIVRIEQDRLQENSPIILDDVIKKFNAAFRDNTSLEKPEIAGDLDHVQINRTMRHTVDSADSSSEQQMYSMKSSSALYALSPKVSSPSAVGPSIDQQHYSESISRTEQPKVEKKAGLFSRNLTGKPTSSLNFSDAQQAAPLLTNFFSCTSLFDTTSKPGKGQDQASVQQDTTSLTNTEQDNTKTIVEDVQTIVQEQQQNAGAVEAKQDLTPIRITVEDHTTP